MKILALASILLLSACAVAPLSNHVTARTNGEGDSLASAGSTLGVGDMGWLPSLKYSVGLSEDFDIGFQYEVIEYGVWGKYAFLNRQEGWSAAGLVGTGLGLEGYYGYLGPVVSLKTGKWEPYFISRFNYVRYKQRKTSLDSTGEFSVNPGTYRYFQHTLGFLYWPKHWFGLGLEASLLNTWHSPYILRGKPRYLLSWNASFRF